MDMTGEQRIPADRETVWKALNDTEILRASIPGCQELVKTSDTEMSAVAVVKVGPISARFQGKVTLSDLDPPNGYRITGEGQGGVAGHAKGGAVVSLLEDGGETILRYEVTAQVGGRLAQLGGRMIDATAKTMSAAFFTKFAQEIVRSQRGEAEPAEAVRREPVAVTVPQLPSITQPSGGMQPSSSVPAWLWVMCGLLMGALLSAMVGTYPVDRGVTHAMTIDTLALISTLLAGLLGFTAGRQR